MRARGWGGALLLGAALGGACAEGPGSTPPGVIDGGDARGSDGDGDVSGAVSCAWDVLAPELTLPEGELQGVLRGSSRNASTTCTRQKGTGGPEAIYLLRLEQRTLVDLEVISDLDTVLAIRRACDDPLTEVACSDGPRADGSEMAADAGDPDGSGERTAATVAVDAAAPGARGSRDAHLRASLAAGTYHVLVDEAGSSGVGGTFRLRVRASTPPTQTTCPAAPVVSDGTRLLAEELDLASEETPCGAEAARPALFYRASVPPGARLTAQVVTTAGDRPWTPVIDVFTGCAGDNLCLAGAQVSFEGLSVVRYINNGPEAQTVLLSVSAAKSVMGALFRLDVTIRQPPQNVSCQAAQPLSDGMVLHDQDLADAQVDGNDCKVVAAPSLFYTARLHPGQRVHLSVVRPDGQVFSPLAVRLTGREGCASQLCLAGNLRNFNAFSYVNRAPEPRTVVIEASAGLSGDVVAPFDLRVEMPLPPVEILLQADRDLVTTEAGGQATFRVVLNAPGTAVVEVPVSSSDPQEGTVRPAVLRFSPETWDQPQTVTVSGVDDDRKDGRRPYTVEVGPAVSADPRYAGLEGGQVAVSNLDDEPGFRTEAPPTLVTSEAGASARLQVFLNRAPTATVRLAVSSSDEGEGRVSPAELVFEPDTWNQPQTVTVLGIDDDQQDGIQPYQVAIGAASSADARYQGIDPDDLPARNADDDFQRVAARPVNDPTVCAMTRYGGDQLLVVDQATNLYAGLICEDLNMPDNPPTARVATSVDGGRSFGALVDTGLQVDHLWLAGGRAGLVVAAGSGPHGTVITRSEDGGLTWQPMQVLDPASGLYGLAAAGDRVLAYTFFDTTASIWISGDGARTFGPPMIVDAGMMGVDPDGTVWSLAHEGQGFVFRRSKDGGVTFSPGPFIPFGAPRGLAVGPTLLYHLGKELQVVPRDGSAPLRPVATNPFYYAKALYLRTDQKDNVTLFVVEGGQVEAHRLNVGDSSFGPARVLGHTWSTFSAVPLSDRAIAVMLFKEGSAYGTISVAVETWP